MLLHVDPSMTTGRAIDACLMTRNQCAFTLLGPVTEVLDGVEEGVVYHLGEGGVQADVAHDPAWEFSRQTIFSHIQSLHV